LPKTSFLIDNQLPVEYEIPKGQITIALHWVVLHWLGCIIGLCYSARFNCRLL